MRHTFGVSYAQQDRRILTREIERVGQLMGEFRKLIRWVEVRMGEAYRRRRKQEALQRPTQCHPLLHDIVVGGEQDQVGGRSDLLAVAAVLRSFVECTGDHVFGDEARQIRGAEDVVTQSVVLSVAMLFVVTHPAAEFGFECVVLHLQAVAAVDQFGDSVKSGRAMLVEMDVDRGCNFDGPQLVDVCRGDYASVVHPAISLPEGDLREERRRCYVGLAIKPDADRAVLRNGHRRAVALMRGGYAEVFRCATEADEQLPIVRIDYGQCPAVVGADVDLRLADSEQPRLCVMPRRGFDGLLDQEQEVRVLGLRVKYVPAGCYNTLCVSLRVKYVPVMVQLSFIGQGV